MSAFRRRHRLPPRPTSGALLPFTSPARHNSPDNSYCLSSPDLNDQLSRGLSHSARSRPSCGRTGGDFDGCQDLGGMAGLARQAALPCSHPVRLARVDKDRGFMGIPSRMLCGLLPIYWRRQAFPSPQSWAALMGHCHSPRPVMDEALGIERTVLIGHSAGDVSFKDSSSKEMSRGFVGRMSGLRRS